MDDVIKGGIVGLLLACGIKITIFYNNKLKKHSDTIKKLTDSRQKTINQIKKKSAGNTLIPVMIEGICRSLNGSETKEDIPILNERKPLLYNIYKLRFYEETNTKNQKFFQLFKLEDDDHTKILVEPSFKCSILSSSITTNHSSIFLNLTSIIGNIVSLFIYNNWCLGYKEYLINDGDSITLYGVLNLGSEEPIIKAIFLSAKGAYPILKKLNSIRFGFEWKTILFGSVSALLSGFFLYYSYSNLKNFINYLFQRDPPKHMNFSLPVYVNSFMCLNCLKNPVAIFGECRHLAVCDNCFHHKDVSTCQLCKKPIQNPYKVFSL